MRKKETYTNITPIPACVPRQLALDILHSHGEIITLNPLVLSYHPIKAPRDAVADEYYSTWYEIIERVQYLPGLGKMGSGKVSFKGCFNDTEWGLVTHTFVPLGIDIKSKWRIAGYQPDETRKFKDFRHEAAPENGLYLQEDIEINCNITLISFVKSQLKAASKVLVDRLIKKAELLDAGVLQGVVEDGRLKTINPADRTSIGRSDSLASSRRHSDVVSLNSYQLPRSPTGSTYPYKPSPYGQEKTFSAAELPADSYHPHPPPGMISVMLYVRNSAASLPGNLDGYRGKAYAAELPATFESPEGQYQSRNIVHELPESRH